MPSRLAIIFVPDWLPDAGRWLEHCQVYCLAHGYQVVSVIRRWCDVERVLAGGTRAVVVAGRPDHIEGVEFVSEAKAGKSPMTQRPARR